MKMRLTDKEDGEILEEIVYEFEPHKEDRMDGYIWSEMKLIPDFREAVFNYGSMIRTYERIEN